MNNINFGDGQFTQEEANHIANTKNTQLSDKMITDYTGWYSRNHKKEDIIAVQKALGLKADGNVGRKTMLAIFAYEKQNNLKNDGLLTDADIKNITTKYSQKINTTHKKSIQHTKNQQMNKKN